MSDNKEISNIGWKNKNGLERIATYLTIGGAIVAIASGIIRADDQFSHYESETKLTRQLTEKVDDEVDKLNVQVGKMENEVKHILEDQKDIEESVKKVEDEIDKINWRLRNL